MWKTAFSPFPKMFSTLSITNFSFSFTLICCLQKNDRLIKWCFTLTHYQTTNFKLFQTLSQIERVCRRQFQIWKLSKWVENTVGKGEIARYQQFLLSRSVFKRLVSQRRQKVSLCGNGLTFSQTTNFRLFQTKRVCRRQFQILWKWQKALQTCRKHCGKRRNCSLGAISPFPTVFSNDLYSRHVKSRACLGKG